jgi:hypothetical protein
LSKQIVVLTEEGPSESLVGAINYFLHFEDSEQRLLNSSVPSESIDKAGNITAIGWEYPLAPGKFSKVVCKIVSPAEKGSFVDVLFYVTEDDTLPQPSDPPSLAVEVTKNGLGESNNMSDQRAAKFYSLLKRYPEVPCCYYIHTVSPIEKCPPPHQRSFRRMTTNGIRVVFGSNQGFSIQSFEPYKSVEDFLLQGQSSRPRVNYLLQEGSEVLIKTNLQKNGNFTHDPNIGWLGSNLWTLKSLGFQGNVSLISHRLDDKTVQKAFKGKTRNKLVKLMYDMASSFETLSVSGIGNIESQDLYQGNYWQYSSSGEKVGSIQQEIILAAKTGAKTIFSNHAGCEKSYLVTLDGDSEPLPKGPDYGLPDLLMVFPNKKEIIAIEAEQSKNLKKGYKQVYEPKFKNLLNKIKSDWYNDYTFSVYLSTFGDDTIEEDHVIASTTWGGQTKLNLQAQPAYVV